MSELRDAIAIKIGLWDEFPNGSAGFSTDEADAVLAMPEMQAIRKALMVLHMFGGPNYLEIGLDLPASVVAWVLGDAP